MILIENFLPYKKEAILLQMELFIRCDETIVIEVDQNETTERLKSIIYHNWTIPPIEQIITYRDKNDCLRQKQGQKSSADCSFSKDYTLYVWERIRGGGCCCKTLSIINEIQYDLNILRIPLIPGNLSQRYFRNTNATRVYKQNVGTF